jgi:hypothetical protein
MGFLDHLLDPLTGVGGGGKWLHRNAVKGGKLLRDGTSAQARIVGIRVGRGDADSPDVQDYALVFAGDAGPRSAPAAGSRSATSSRTSGSEWRCRSGTTANG